MLGLKHVTSDDGHDIQNAVHDIAQDWIRRGHCPDCVVRTIIVGASAVAQCAGRWPAAAVHGIVEAAYSPDAKHICPDQH